MNFNKKIIIKISGLFPKFEEVKDHFTNYSTLNLGNNNSKEGFSTKIS